MKKNILLVFLLSSVFTYSQNDCSDALIACGNSGYQDLNATGVGVQELSGSNTCGSEENNSLWFRININTGGKLGFILTPTFADGSTNTDLAIDFDFFVFGPNVDCGDIGQAIRCSTTNPQAAGTTSNLTGMNSTETETSEGPGALGNNFVSELDVIADDSYFIVIDRPVGTSNFKIEWTGTATFNNPPSATPPTAGESYDLLLCDSDGGNDNSTAFDLTLNENSILNGQPNTSISYHTSNNGALTNSSPIPNPSNYKNIESPENIFIRLTDTNTLCFTTTEFVINAYTTPEIALQPENLIIDDLNNNGSEIVDLTVQDASILGAQDISEFEIVYAADNTFNTIITDPVNHTIAVSLETIYFRIVNQNNITCFSQGFFTVALLINQPPEITANNRVAYCPLNQVNIAPNFTISDPDDTGIDAFFIQISSGYDTGADQLILTGTHPNINTSWNTNEGKLTLTPIGSAKISYTDLELAVRDLIFESTNADISSDRFFSFTIGDAFYLPITDHFYVYEENIGITWSDAKNLAQASTYYGLQGYLATVLIEEESVISAEQITGTGWIGASDEDNEGEWKWVTGPEAGTTFWNGNFSGSPALDPTGIPYYSNWNSDPPEPNQSGNEDYAHITDISIGDPGSWNDIPNTGATDPTSPYHPKGYIVEYGGMPGDPVLQISASTSVYVPEITSFDPELRNCTGGTMTFTATVSEGEIYWYDAPIGGNLVETGDTFTTPSLTSSKTYYVAASPEGCATAQRIAVDAIIDTTPVVLTAPSDINRCDDNRDGFIDFDLQAVQTPIIFDGLNPILNPDLTKFEILYFDDPLDAEANITAAIIDNPYRVDTSDNPTIYARIHNKDNTTCFAITSFKLKVTDTPTPTDPSDYRLCDDTVSVGGDTDGVSSFLLNTKDIEIIGVTANSDNYTISYHTDPIGAQNNTISTTIPKDIDYKVTTSQTVYVRIENNNDPTQCYTVSDNSTGSLFTSFELIVDPLPVVNSGIEINYCIVTGDSNPTVDLTQAEDEVSPTTGARFEYFKDSSGLIPIPDPVSYSPVGNVLQSVYVKVFSDDCPRDLVELFLNIGEIDDINPFADVVAMECDDFLDPDGNYTPGINDDTDNITNFFLNETNIVAAITPPMNTKVFFYESTADRNSNISIPDITNYRNDPTNIDITDIPGIGISFPIYYKILSTINNDCQGIGQFYLQIQSVPIANTPANFDLCDDDLSGNTTDGINNGINLRNRVDDILGPTQIGLGYDVTFHTSQADADDPTSMGIPDDTNFTNTPQAGFTKGDISEQTIFVRVKNTDRCINNPTSFKIIVNPIPSISNTINPFPVCDIVTSSDGDPRNRIAQNIDLTSKNSEILAGKTNHKVAYYLTQPDAENNIEIVNPTNFQNISALTSFPTDFNTDEPAIQTIFVKVFDLGGNKCSSVFSTFKVVIYPEPNIPLNISNYSDCDNMTDSDADDANGINGNIALKNKIPEILANYDPAKFADFAVHFYASLTAAEIGDPTNALNENTFENSINGQEIFVRVENIKNTPIICVNTRLSFNININPLPDFTVMGEENIEDPLIVCLNDTPLVLEVENPLATYTYQWTNQAGDLLGNDPTQNVYLAGKYAVTASESATGCSRERTIVVEESDIANLEQSFINIIDEGNNIGSEDKSSISIDTISNDLGPGDYQFAILNTDNGNRTPFAGFQDEPLFENLEGGIYTIIVNDKNGCVPDATLQVSVLQFPKFFTPNGDGRNDTYRVKGANKTFYPNSSINIFNRYGKLVAQIPIDSQGWNGTYNGKKLSSDDYWYNITLIPADNTKQIINKTGNFSLLRK